MKRVVVSFFVAASLLLISRLPSARAADDGLNLVTSPLPISLVAEPGKTVTTELRVKNGGSSGERLKVDLMKFAAYGEEGKPVLAEREAGDDYFDWVSFSPKTFDAPPGQWQTVKMTVTLPKTAAFGYYYAVVFSSADKPKPAPGKRTVFVGSSASLVLLEAKVPGAKRELQMLGFSADKRVYEFLPSTFSIRLHNSGNIHLSPRGNIFISRRSKPIATLDVNSEKGNILPGSNRIFASKWRDGFPVYVNREENGHDVTDVKGNTIHQLKWDFTQVPKLRIGRYTAKVVLSYDNGQRDVPLEGTLTFWVMPWRLFLIALAVPIIPALIVYLVMRRRMKRRGRQT